MSRLLANSTPADRIRKCVFAERFEGAANLAKNGGVISGSATWVNNGLQLNTVTSSVDITRSLSNPSSWTVFGGVVEFTPNWAHDDNAIHILINTNTSVFTVYKNSASNTLIVRAGSLTVLIAQTSDYASYWKPYARNIISWTCISGTNYLYLNGTLVKTSSTAWSAGAIASVTIGASNNASTGIYHNLKLFAHTISAQALTAKDCEVLSAGTTYTYWKNATCIMDGLAANYDIANYRHLDLSGNANHVLLGNGAGTGTPTKLTTQGYSFNGTTQYMTVPLAAWPGTPGTILFDVSSTSVTVRFIGSDHTLGSSYEFITSSASGSIRAVHHESGVGRAVNLGEDTKYNKRVYATTWRAGGTVGLAGYRDGEFYTSGTLNGTADAPDVAWWLMKYNSEYASGSLRSFLAFSRELSSLQIADATLWMQNLRNKT